MKKLIAALVVTSALVLSSALPAAASGTGKGYGSGGQKCGYVWCVFPGQVAGCC